MRFGTELLRALIALGPSPARLRRRRARPRHCRAQAAAGQAVFNRSCASCHAPGQHDQGADARQCSADCRPEAIVNALINGKMTARRQGCPTSRRRGGRIPEWPGARAAVGQSDEPTVGRCTTSTPMTDPAKGPAWSGWGAAIHELRATSATAVPAASDLPN
jgi:hypothetical protein